MEKRVLAEPSEVKEEVRELRSRQEALFVEEGCSREEEAGAAVLSEVAAEVRELRSRQEALVERESSRERAAAGGETGRKDAHRTPIGRCSGRLRTACNVDALDQEARHAAGYLQERRCQTRLVQRRGAKRGYRLRQKEAAAKRRRLQQQRLKW